MGEQRRDWGHGWRICVLGDHGETIPNHGENIFEKVGDRGHSKNNNSRKKNFRIDRRRNFETNIFQFGTASSIVVHSLATWSAFG